MTVAQTSPDASQLAKQFIDASIKGRTKPPSKAAYGRALRMAQEAMAELLQLRDAATRRK
jgi:hypothetical protein